MSALRVSRLLTLTTIALTLASCGGAYSAYAGKCPQGFVPKPDGYHGPGILIVTPFGTLKCVEESHT